MKIRRPKVLVVTALCVFVLLLAHVVGGKFLILNVTPSYPKGFYRMIPHQGGLGETVWVQLDPELEMLLWERNYIPRGGHLLKAIVGVAGDTYCVESDRFVIGDRSLGPIFKTDTVGRALPQLSDGCQTVPEKHVLLGSTRITRSFDSRYFGPVPTQQIISGAELAWSF